MAAIISAIENVWAKVIKLAPFFLGSALRERNDGAAGT
jgi:hypothetical protein